MNITTTETRERSEYRRKCIYCKDTDGVSLPICVKYSRGMCYIGNKEYIKTCEHNSKHCDRMKKYDRKIANIELADKAKFAIGQVVWFLEYGDLAMKTTIRGYERRGEKIEYYLSGKMYTRGDDTIFATKKEAELEILRHKTHAFINSVRYAMDNAGITKEEFANLLGDNIKLLGSNE